MQALRVTTPVEAGVFMVNEHAYMDTNRVLIGADWVALNRADPPNYATVFLYSIRRGASAPC